QTPPLAVGTHVLVAMASSGQKLPCVVTKADADGVKVGCPKDAAPEATEVTYVGIDPSAPPPGEKPSETPRPGETETPTGEAPKGETPKGEMPKGENAKGENVKGETPKGETKVEPPPRPR